MHYFYSEETSNPYVPSVRAKNQPAAIGLVYLIEQNRIAEYTQILGDPDAYQKLDDCRYIGESPRELVLKHPRQKNVTPGAVRKKLTLEEIPAFEQALQDRTNMLTAIGDMGSDFVGQTMDDVTPHHFRGPFVAVGFVSRGDGLDKALAVSVVIPEDMRTIHTSVARGAKDFPPSAFKPISQQFRELLTERHLPPVLHDAHVRAYRRDRLVTMLRTSIQVDANGLVDSRTVPPHPHLSLSGAIGFRTPGAFVSGASSYFAYPFAKPIPRPLLHDAHVEAYEHKQAAAKFMEGFRSVGRPADVNYSPKPPLSGHEKK